MRPKLTYANVMATVAVFLALGGFSYAALRLPKNSVGTKQLKKNAVKGSKVARDTLTGSDINESTLATVPTATDAQTLGGRSAAQFAASASSPPRPSCPAGMQAAGGVCFEGDTREDKILEDAMLECANDGLRLPSEGELIIFQKQRFSEPPPFEWVEPLYYKPEASGMIISASANSLSMSYAAAALSIHPYRCVTGIGP